MLTVRTKWSKKLKLKLPSNRDVIVHIGRRAATMIERRVRGRGVDGDGKRMHPLSRKPFTTSADDPRFKGTDLQPRNAKGSKGKPTLLVDPKGYAHAKRAVGAKPARDGSLTGAMWRGITVGLKRIRGQGLFVRLFFTGSQKVGVSKTLKTKTGRAKTIRVTNKLKATQLQRRGRTGAAVVRLLSLQDSEIGLLRDWVVSRIKLSEK